MPAPHLPTPALRCGSMKPDHASSGLAMAGYGDPHMITAELRPFWRARWGCRCGWGVIVWATLGGRARAEAAHREHLAVVFRLQAPARLLPDVAPTEKYLGYAGLPMPAEPPWPWVDSLGDPEPTSGPAPRPRDPEAEP